MGGKSRFAIAGVGNLNTVGIAGPPYKTDSPLPVDPNAVPAFSFIL